MGFKISSLSNMSSIANTMSSMSSETNSYINSTKTSLDGLTKTISGDNVEQTLIKLRDAISTNGDSAVKLLSDISSFITSQVGSYTSNEQDISTTLNDVDAAMQQLEV